MPQTSRQNPIAFTFSPEMRLLTALVARALGLPRDIGSDLMGLDWNRFCEIAQAHRVLALAHSGLQAAPEIVVPSDVSSRLAGDARKAWRRSLILTHELARLSRLFEDHGVAMLALKGPALAAQVYDTPALRAMRDLDVLIRAVDFPLARQVLEANGFICEEAVRQLTPAQQSLYRRSATHISFQSVTLGYWVEVHLRPLQVLALFPISTESLMTHADTVRLGGCEVPTLALPDHFLYIAAHGAKHGWWRLLWLADFAAFHVRYPEWFSEENGGKDEAAGLRRMLRAAAWLSQFCFGTLASPLEKQGRAIAVHGLQCLERGRPPMTYPEKWAELANLLRLRSEPRYYFEVFHLYWSLTPDDLACVFLPALPSHLYPALRPFFWACRRWLHLDPPRKPAEAD